MVSQIIKYCFYLLFAVTPLLFTPFNQELFEYNKMMFVYTLTVIIFGFWIIRMISEQKLILKKTLLNIPLGVFLISQVISTIFSIDPHTSFWGYYSRSNGGLLSIISYITLYFAFVANFEKADIFKFLKAALLGGLVVSFYAIPEHFGVSPSCIILTQEFSASCWVQDVQSRVFGTLGQPNWLAAYLAMLIFPAIYFFIVSKNWRSKSYYLLLTTCYYLAFTFTYSRGATLGFLTGLGVFVTSLLLALKPRVVNPETSRFGVKVNLVNLKPLASIILIFIVINLFFGSALTDFKLLKEPAIHSRPDLLNQALPSGTQLENGGTESGTIRLIVWKGALEIFKAYPLFGSGVETFAYAYYQYRPSEHNFVSEWDFLYNKAHNEYLNYLATTGLFGFISYLSIITTFIVFCIRYYVSSIRGRSQDMYSMILISSLLAGYISFLVQDFFLFSVVTGALLFYLFPALAFVFTDSTKVISEKNIAVKNLNSLFKLISRYKYFKKGVEALVLIIVLSTLYRLYSYWEADTLFKKGSDYNDAGNPGKAYNYLVEAVKLNPVEPLYLSELGHAAGSSALALVTDNATVSGELKDDAIFFTETAINISPHNTTILRTAIRTFFELTLLDPSLESRTIDAVNRAIELSPTDPKLYQNKGIVLNQFKRFNEATASLHRAIELKPNYIDAINSLADIYFKAGLMEQARTQFEAALKLTPGDPVLIQQIEETKK